MTAKNFYFTLFDFSVAGIGVADILVSCDNRVCNHPVVYEILADQVVAVAVGS